MIIRIKGYIILFLFMYYFFNKFGKVVLVKFVYVIGIILLCRFKVFCFIVKILVLNMGNCLLCMWLCRMIFVLCWNGFFLVLIWSFLLLIMRIFLVFRVRFFLLKINFLLMIKIEKIGVFILRRIVCFFGIIMKFFFLGGFL